MRVGDTMKRGRNNDDDSSPLPGGKRIQDKLIHVREVATARLRARGLTIPMIAEAHGVSERQVYRDIVGLRERHAELAEERVTIEEEYLELQRAAWQDHDVEKSGQAKAMHMRNLIEIQDRKAKLLGVVVTPEPAGNAQAIASSAVFVINGEKKRMELLTDEELDLVEGQIVDSLGETLE